MRITILIPPDAHGLEIAGLSEVFDEANRCVNGPAPYEVLHAAAERAPYDAPAGSTSCPTAASTTLARYLTPSLSLPATASQSIYLLPCSRGYVPPPPRQGALARFAPAPLSSVKPDCWAAGMSPPIGNTPRSSRGGSPRRCSNQIEFSFVTAPCSHPPGLPLHLISPWTWLRRTWAERWRWRLRAGWSCS